MRYKRKKATALKYDGQQSNAPKVTATGRGPVAKNILNKAQKAGVPVKEDSSLAGLLDELYINETIPPELYQAVAEVFAFVYHADRIMETDH